jgi:hypothetical protein
MADSEVLSKILERVKISTKDLEKYNVDLEQVSSVRFLIEHQPTIFRIPISLTQEDKILFLGVNSNYFDQYLETLNNNGIKYHFFEKQYRYVILKGAKFAIRDDSSYAKSRM